MEVVYARKEFDLVDYNGSKSHKGCVVIEHETEIGNNVTVNIFRSICIYVKLKQGLIKVKKLLEKRIGLVWSTSK